MCGICGAAWTDPARSVGDRDLASMVAGVRKQLDDLKAATA